ncbi:phytase [Podospora didyma]|uniref:Phytase n=1 Tax=Podospora didyma TaxID=330526 RepID=A0AAE0NXY6_9PEZI|nr:phytase [Podospora didyma]
MKRYLLAPVLHWMAHAAAASISISANVAIINTGSIESDSTATYYSTTKNSSLLLGNDGGAASGGFHAWSLKDDDNKLPLPEVKHLTTGRSKLITTAYGIGGKDVAITIAMPDSVIRVFEVPSFTEVVSARFTELGDWSALCSWKSKSRNQYFFLFGKHRGIQYLLRETKNGKEVVKIRSFEVPIEADGCAVSETQSVLYLSTGDDKSTYAFDLSESTDTPSVSQVGKTEDDITGLAVYHGKGGSDVLFVAHEDQLAAYQVPALTLIGTVKLGGLEDIEVQGPSIFQAATDSYTGGLLALAVEWEDGKGFGVVGLDDVLSKLGITPNTEYDPRKLASSCRTRTTICEQCSTSGYCKKTGGDTSCACFWGFTGTNCQQFTCSDNCSGHGQCVGPDVCACDAGWGGLHCSFVLVQPDYETTANGGDGDDPAIWISPVASNLSRIITTTKSGDGAGLAVFDLTGRLLQSMPAAEPNNVDVIYGFEMGGPRKVDLVFAACRGDDTLCLFEMSTNGTLATVAGGSHPVVDDFTVYGSCTYRSPQTGKQYLFVNEKSARYLQYELTIINDTLTTTLVRDFTGGSGGQVEGCVTDEENGWIFIGEEPSALWRYPAEPDTTPAGVAIARVGDGHLFADVEGVTLVYGPSPDKGFILVSCQGVSAYNVYRRAAPHEYVATFTLVNSSSGAVDAVSNTDGIAAVGNALGPDFPHGLVVVHDDANQLPGGQGTNPEASFKLVSLASILGSPALAALNLLADVDANWDPRKQ